MPTEAGPIEAMRLPPRLSDCCRLEEMILEYLQAHDEIANGVVRRPTGIGSENTVKRIFLRMIKAGELESISGRPLRDAAYRCPGPGPAVSAR